MNLRYKKKGKLDFNAIYDVLKFGIVKGFISGESRQRYTPVYSIIRLLEIHFDSYLGDNKKFNKSISNFLYDSSNRAFLWRVFLKEKGHVVRSKNEVPSMSSEFYN